MDNIQVNKEFNIMNKFKIVVALVLVGVLYGCASPAQIDSMVYTGNQKNYPEEIENNIRVANTTGGEETNPMWTSEIDNTSLQAALQRSLDQQGLLSETGDYKLDVTLLETDQPIFGINFKVTTIIKYVVTEISSANIIFEESITAPFTAGVSDAFAAIKRLRLANEGSVRTNIGMFLDKLSGLDPTVRLSMLHSQ